MAELPNYPFINQLNSPTLDGRPDENKWFNCVICSILSAMLYRKPELRGKITPDSMKDAVLGEGYANQGTDARWFVNYVARYGLKLSSVNGNVVELAHKLIQENKPAIFTEIDPYVDTSEPQYAGWTHVCSFYKEIAGGLDAMDPFGGKIVSKSDQEWSHVAVGTEVWTVDLVEEKPTMTIPQGWHDDGTTLVAPNGMPVVRGFRAYVLAHNWSPENYPIEAERGTPQLEDSNPQLGSGTQQVFRWSMLGYTQSRGVFEEWLGQELLVARQQVAKYYQRSVDLQKQLDALKAEQATPIIQPDPQVAVLEAENAKLVAALEKVKADATIS